MDAPITEAMNIQTFMIVWDINLKTTNKVNNNKIRSPLFSIVPNKNENTKWILLERIDSLILITSSFIKELKECTTYMIDPITCTLLDIFKGLDAFTRYKHDWSEKMRFVFELEIQCNAPVVQPTIWTHFITETKPGITTNDILLNLDVETSNHTVVNSSGVACVAKQFIEKRWQKLFIEPETASKNWNLITVMSRKLKNNTLDRYHIHSNDICSGSSFRNFQPITIIEIHELTTYLKDMAVCQMAAITRIVNSDLTPLKRISVHSTDKCRSLPSVGDLLPTGKEPLGKNVGTVCNDRQLSVGVYGNALQKDSNELQQQQSISATLIEYFINDTFCDFTVQVGDQQVRAHKVILAAGSAKLRDSFYKNKALATILINDFNVGTIKQLIEYMYGIVKQPVEAPDQLLSAAYKYGVAGLKEHCEEQLIKAIDMKNVINLLVLADRCEVDVLFDKVLAFIRENFAEFVKLEDIKSLFMIHPELALKLFEKK